MRCTEETRMSGTLKMTPLSRYPVGPRSSQKGIPLLAVAFGLVALSGPAMAQTGAHAPAPVRSCRSLSSLTNFQFSVVEARTEPASEDTPEHCRLYGRILPDIRFAVYLPTEWNGRLSMRGNGGWAGSLPEGGMMVDVREGSVSVGTDTGHDRRRQPSGSFTLDRQQLTDFAYRSVHLTVEAAKQITAAYYLSPIQFSYFQGCSTGGRQALTAAVFEKCDGLDGYEDGVIDYPPACGFDPETDLPVCDDASVGPGCFRHDQIEALKRVYEGPPFFPGRVVGAEAFVEGSNGLFSPWGDHIIEPNFSLFAEPFLRYMAFEVPDTTYDWRTFDFETDLPKVEWLRRIMDATDTDLRGFRDHGGKMLMYFGWADPWLSPLRGVRYYEDVMDEMGPSTTDFLRLFMTPGMYHCGGGVGVNRLEYEGDQSAWFDDYLEAWVEEGVPPTQLSGLRVEQERVVWTRPICQYPRVARYTGSGDRNDAANWHCQ